MHSKHFEKTMVVDYKMSRVMVTIHHNGDYDGDAHILVHRIVYNATLALDEKGEQLGEITVPCSALLDFAGAALSSTLVSLTEQVNFAALFRGDWRRIFCNVR